MHVFKIEDPNEGLANVLTALKEEGIHATSRNGPVVRFPRPVCLHYVNPRQRLLSSPIRDVNPVFHLVETMWMFGGLNQLQPLLLYNAGMAQYSDDGLMLRGTAYGHRWRSVYNWGDQLQKVVAALVDNPDDRRLVVSMWDPSELGKVTLDQACNLQVIFSTRPAEDGGPHWLDMSVTNRSNDLIYGAMGSNLYHFSMLLEYIALHSELRVGAYYQISANLHLYTENPVAQRCWTRTEEIRPDHISQSVDDSLTRLGLTFDKTLIAQYVLNRDDCPEDEYLRQVVLPLVEAYHVYKIKARTGASVPLSERIGAACALAGACNSQQLSQAATAWFHRRLPALP